MRIFYYVLLLLIISFRLEAQQVKKIDCCYDVTPKATIIINESTSNGTVSSTTTNTTNPSNGVFNFELKSSFNTSAGVYNSSGVLIRTLWNGVRYDGGCYSAHWDGLLDDGTQAPLGVYTGKVLSNNVTYDWLGVIGNTSTDHLGGNQILNPFHSMAIMNGTMYIASGYAERDFKTNKILLSDIGSLYNAVDPTQAVTQTMFAEHVCTNGTYIFWAGGDPYSSAKSFIVASKPADDSQVTFTNGQPVSIGIDGRQYHSALMLSNSIDEVTTGLAASANFLFASRSDSAKVEVFDLRGLSGAKLFSYNLGANPSALAVNGSYLWVSADNITKQYIIGSDGSLVATGLTINVNAGAIAASSSGELAIADNSTQQIKFFNAKTGAQIGTLGQAGGYDSNGPLVTYDKFMFVDSREASTHPRIVYQPDGSFWFADPGNYRTIHFNADKSYKEQIAYVPTARSIAVDPNNPTQVFANALQYQVDYSKVATDINHSWVLKYNWNVGLSLNVFSQFVDVATLRNGHTYATGGNNYSIFDLLPSGAKKVADMVGNENLEQDGSVWTRAMNNDGFATVSKKQLLSFTVNSDGSQTPVWGNYATVVSTPGFATNPDQPVYYINNTVGSSTNPDRYFFFDQFFNAGFPNSNGTNITTGNGYHLGAIKTGGNTWNWQSSKSVPAGYQGQYPQNGQFDLSGQSNPCLANVNGSNVFWHVNQELGRFTETAWTAHYNENGLLIGVFGTDNRMVGYTGDTHFWAGNSFKTQLAKVGNDLYYFYCDESKHGGVHIIKVSNLASLQEQSIPITVSGPVTILSDPNSLMTGLPFQGTSFNGATGWAIENGTPTIQTSVREFDKSLNDISVSGGTSKVSRSLSNQSLTSYTVSGAVNFTNSQFTFNDYHVYNLLEITDQVGKKIVAITSRGDGIWINNTVVAPYTAKDQNLFQDFSFTYNEGILTTKFADYPAISISTTWDSGADRSRPGFLKIDQGQCCGRSDGVSIDLYKLRFVSGQ